MVMGRGHDAAGPTALIRPFQRLGGGWPDPNIIITNEMNECLAINTMTPCNASAPAIPYPFS
jgi:hypothetical protein